MRSTEATTGGATDRGDGADPLDAGRLDWSGRESRSESWVAAVVTLLATVVFGLGWVLVEIERGDPTGDRYDAGVQIAWSATADANSNDQRSTASLGSLDSSDLRSIRARENSGATEQRWSTGAPKRSKR